MQHKCGTTLSTGSCAVNFSASEPRRRFISRQPTTSQPLPRWPQNRGRTAERSSCTKERDAADQLRRACLRFYQHSGAIAEAEALERRRRGLGGGDDGRPERFVRTSARCPRQSSTAGTPSARGRAEVTDAAVLSSATIAAEFASDDGEAAAQQETLRAACKRALQMWAAPVSRTEHLAATTAAVRSRRPSNAALLPPGGGETYHAGGIAHFYGSPRPNATEEGALTSQLTPVARRRQRSVRWCGADSLGEVSGCAAPPPSAEAQRQHGSLSRAGFGVTLTSALSRSSSADSGIKSRDSCDDAAPPPPVATDKDGTLGNPESMRAHFDEADAPPFPSITIPPTMRMDAKGICNLAAENSYVTLFPFGQDFTMSPPFVRTEVAQLRKSSGLSTNHADQPAGIHVICCFCGRAQIAQSPLCSHYRMCRGCEAVYCSVTCRRNARAAHKMQCGYSAAVSRVKRIIRQLLTDHAIRSTLSDFAVSGYIRHGRGVVYLPLGPVGESWCFEEARSAAWNRRFFIRNAALKLLPLGVITPPSNALPAKCTHYDPQTHFVLLSTARFWISDRVKCGTGGKVRAEEYVKLMVLRLRGVPNTEALWKRQTCSFGGETLVVSPTSSSYDAATFGHRARQLFFVNVQTALRSRGVSLRLQHPELYSDLCRYVECGGDFKPVSLFGTDCRSGRRFMCCILPPPKSYAD